MKLQGLGILFALIVLPVILVLTYYIQLQVNTINLQNQYDTKLLDATHDAMSSFEINTANEDLSSVSDSLRTIIEASTNVFFNSLATNFGMSNASKSYIEPYIPAILYTLYDGYYIYSPTKVPTVLTDTDGNAVSVGDIGVTKSDNNYSYSYQVVHTTQEQQNNCAECKDPNFLGHVGYVEYSKLNESQFYLGSGDIGNDYGQLLYLTNQDSVYTSNINDAKLKTKNVLKSYMPYSARYIHGDGEDKIDINVIYTLDNYVTIEGTIGNVYYSKSGYLLPQNENDDSIDCVDIDKILNYSQSDAQEIIENGSQEVDVTIDGISFNNLDEDNNNINVKDLKEDLKGRNNHLENLRNELAKLQQSSDATIDNISGIENEINKEVEEINKIQYNLDKVSAIVYYTKAVIFSNWVYNNLGEIEERDLVEISGQNYKSVNGHEEVTYNFEESEKKIFDVKGSTSNGVVEISQDSSFYTHKLNVIRNSIQYNLNLAMSTYNNISASASDYSMPVMSNIEWDKILTNVSITSFMQGNNCGLKIYNNYMIVSSTNNEIAVDPNNIYYVKKDQFNDGNTQYHRIDCEKLMEDANENDEYIAFTSKEVKYDKIYDKTNPFLQYKYDHRNFACYDCINDGNYEKNNIFDSSITDEEKMGKLNSLKTAYYIGVAKCRNDLYKMNAVQNSQGYEIIYNNNNDTNRNSSLNISEIKSIEIVFGAIKKLSSTNDTIKCKLKINNKSVNEEEYSIPVNSPHNYSIKCNINFQEKYNLNYINLSFYSSDIISDDIKNAIKCVKVIYK